MKSSGVPLVDRVVDDARDLLLTGSVLYVDHRHPALARSQGRDSLVHRLAERHKILPTRVVTLLRAGGFSPRQAVRWWSDLGRPVRECPVVGPRGSPRLTKEDRERRRALFGAVRAAYGQHHALREDDR